MRRTKCMVVSRVGVSLLYGALDIGGKGRPEVGP